MCVLTTKSTFVEVLVTVTRPADQSGICGKVLRTSLMSCKKKEVFAIIITMFAHALLDISKEVDLERNIEKPYGKGG